MKIFLFLISILIIFSSLYAGWERTYGGSEIDIGSSVQQTMDGGYIVVGSSESFGPGWSDFWLIKTAANGETSWTKTYGGSNDYDYGYSVDQTSDGGFILTGSTNSYGAGELDLWLIKTDENGDTIWTKTYGGSEDDCGNSVQQVSDGGYIITGYTGSTGSGYNEVLLIKTNINGDIIWSKTFGGLDGAIGNCIQQTNDGGYIIVGSTWISNFANYPDIYVIKTNSIGDTNWTRIFGCNDRDIGYSIQQTNDGGYILIGQTAIQGPDDWDAWLIKTNNNGDSIWTRVISGSTWDGGYSVQQTFDSGFIVSGSSCSFGAGSHDVWLIKTDSNGDTVWTKTFGGISGDYGNSVKETSDNGFIICGSTESYGSGIRDIYLIKTNENGVPVNEIIISKPSEFSYSIDQISRNNVSIEFSLPVESMVEINIFDACGRKISTSGFGYYPAGNHSVDFHLDRSGIYFFSISTEDDQIFEKLNILE
ncbi:MAG: hypothetical protein APR63_13955 [Desulfuromonas sp. SDB]|nr:MAG: hypothetical protein APR63_13955 [Desulfuromonas sp. SDB]